MPVCFLHVAEETNHWAIAFLCSFFHRLCWQLGEWGLSKV